ncbi:HAD-IA family hydrolase [Phaeobacter sp. QD34_3]|uniref:HAD-IA family hydrolase n=1 Tax=unclassified Phaeobacter TaxID=2621772 RepID=UPI00237F07B9|nr:MULTISPECIES: HAD-IA family hydrolase [unclassified Phaeobacter]MDE4132764.1 HAD-IA family hydrolase [Phaeobacter sp. QD34_3]MDE4136443.1 HAD-IA family hydrolase [Phaeobacter sp. QD34_24]
MPEEKRSGQQPIVAVQGTSSGQSACVRVSPPDGTARDRLRHALHVVLVSGHKTCDRKRSTEMAKCLMLDVDGVLIDGRPTDGQRWDKELEQDLGVPSEALINAFFKSQWAEIVVGRKDLLPALGSVLERIAPQVKPQELVDYWFKMDSRIVDDVLADCRAARCQGIPIYLATNQEHMRVEHLRRTLALSEEVDGILYSAQAGFRKPQAEFFAYAAQATGCQPHDLLLVDDTVANVKAARHEGWEAVHWDGSETLSMILDRCIRR